jgi:hypothetical protein
MSVTKTIRRGGDFYQLHANGNIAPFGATPSGQWKVIGAVTLNNFGNVTERYTLHQIFNLPTSIPWHFKNGKQKTFLIVSDYGSKSMWVSPKYTIS